MRLHSLIALVLVTTASLVSAQEIQGPQPGVFVYDYDAATESFTRTYYNTQAEANQALAERLTAARLTAIDLNNRAQTNYEIEAVAQWLLFGEQWMLWQEWVLQEYGLEPAEGSSQSDLLGQMLIRFNPVEGVPPRWERAAAPTPGQGLNNRPSSGYNEREGGAASFGPEGEALLGAEGNQNQTAAPQTLPANIHFLEFVQMDQTMREAQMETVQTYLQQAVQERANSKYQVLDAILASIDERELMRERRAAYIATRQTRITDLRDVILNHQAATEIVIDGRRYLFSDQPLNRIPNDTVNIPTPHLSPYDIFNEDGSVRSVDQ